MSLTLHYHPLSSFCWKVLIALYENATPFETHLVDLSDEAARTDFRRLWPMGKFPVLVDSARGRTVAESTTIIEYLSDHCPGPTELVPRDRELAFESRRLDRFYDLHVHLPMQKIVGDRLRPAEMKDPMGVDQATAQIRTAYEIAEGEVSGRTWAVGDVFTIADCAACPALHYANRVVPIGDTHPKLAAYLQRLRERPSFARALAEAKPYDHNFPR